MKKLIVILCCSIVLMSGCSNNKVYRETAFLFDTEVYIEAYGKNAESVVKDAIATMREIDEITNSYSDQSEVSTINEAAGASSVIVSPLFQELLTYSIEMAKLTKGLFDPTIGPLVTLWKQAEKEQILPTNQQIEKACQLVNYQLIEIDETMSTVFLPIESMKLDFGAIAKGFAVSKAVSILETASISSALVRAGGNIYTIGEKIDNQPWEVGIRNPIQLDETISYIETSNEAIDTAGAYEQSYQINDESFGHIINPYTGYPENKVLSVTDISDNSAYADVLSTTLFILGKDEGLSFIEKMPDCEALFIDKNANLFTSSHFPIQ